METMQFCHALESILHEILLTNAIFGPVQLMKADLSNGFNRVDFTVGDIPKLGLIVPSM